MRKFFLLCGLGLVLLALALGSSRGTLSGTAEPNYYEPPIEITFNIHFDPVLDNYEKWRERKDNLLWLQSFVEGYSGIYQPKLNLQLQGDQAEFYLDSSDPEAAEGRAALAALYQAGHTFGTHAHSIIRGEAPHSWYIVQGTPTAAQSVEYWQDHLGYVEQLYATITGNDDPAFLQQMNASAMIFLPPGMEAQRQAFAGTYSDPATGETVPHGFTIQTGGPDERFSCLFDHEVENPWRPGPQGALDEDLTNTVFVRIPGLPPLGKIGVHGQIPDCYQDTSLPSYQRMFLQTFLERLYHEYTGAQEKVWTFGWHEHLFDLYPTGTRGPGRRAFREDVQQMVDWLNERFIGRTTAGGNSVARYATMPQVRDEFLAWEADNPGVSSFELTQYNADWEDYPYDLKELARELANAHYDAALLPPDSTLQVYRFERCPSALRGETQGYWAYESDGSFGCYDSVSDDGKPTGNRLPTKTVYVAWRDAADPEPTDLTPYVGHYAMAYDGVTGQSLGADDVLNALPLNYRPVLLIPGPAGPTSTPAPTLSFTSPASPSFLAVNGFYVASRVAQNQGIDTPAELETYLQSQVIPYFVDLGATWGRIHPDALGSFAWGNVDPDLDGRNFDFTYQDLYVRLAQENGIQLLPSLSPLKGDEWQTAASYVPADMAAYQACVQATVERYDGDGVDDMPSLRTPLKDWQLDNEADLRNQKRSGGTYTGFMSPEEYLQVLVATHQAMKAADPDARLMISLAGVGQALGDYGLEYLRRLMDAGASPNFDALSYHVYSTTYDDAAYASALEQMKSLVGDRPIWITETAVPSRSVQGFEDPGSEAEQARWLVRSYVYHVANGVSHLLWLRLTDASPDMPERPPKYGGLMTFGVSPQKKATYYTFRLLSQKLSGAVSVSSLGEGRYLFERPDGEKIAVLWSEPPEIVDLSPAFGERTLLLTHIVEDASRPEPLTEDVPATAVPVSASPVLVELAPEEPTPTSASPAGYLIISYNANYLWGPPVNVHEATADRFVPTLNRHLDLMDSLGIPADYYFTGLAAEHLADWSSQTVTRLLNSDHGIHYHGANRPPYPQLADQVRGQDWEADVATAWTYEAEGANPANGEHVGGMAAFREVFGQDPFATGRFFEASILYVDKQLGARMGVGLKDNTGASRDDAWFLGVLNRPTQAGLSASGLAQAAIEDRADEYLAYARSVLTGVGGSMPLVAFPIHDHDFFDHSPADQEKVWALYEQVLRLALDMGFQPLTMREVYARVQNGPAPTLTRDDLLAAAQSLVDTMEATGYPPEYVEAGGVPYSLAEIFEALARALAYEREMGALPDSVETHDLLGPTEYLSSDAMEASLSVDAVLEAAAAVAEGLTEKIPSQVAVGDFTVNPAECLYLMAQEFIAIAGGGPAPVDLQPISVLPLTVLQNGEADPLTRLQFWMYKPAVF